MSASKFELTVGEAVALHGWLKAQEKMYADKANYVQAKHCNQRARELERAFWPEDEWEKAWSR